MVAGGAGAQVHVPAHGVQRLEPTLVPLAYDLVQGSMP